MKTKYFLNVLIVLLTSTVNIQSQNINSGLVAHWSFDNDSGTIIVDNSSNYFNGTSHNISYETGVTGKAAVFNNPLARIYFPEINKFAPDSISNLNYGSVSVWFNFTSIGAQVLPILYFGESNSGTPHNSLIIEIGHGRGMDQTNRRLYFTIVNQRFCFDSRFNLSENTWYHFVAVVSPTGNTGYLNGEEMINRRYNLGSNYTYTDFFNDVPVKKMLSLGYGRYGQEDAFYTFNGSIDDVRIYSKPLSQVEVTELYALGSTVMKP